MKRPIVGILADVDGNLVTSVKRDYISAIEGCGGIPFVFPYVQNDEILGKMIGACDGIFFTGGVDISPCRYGEEKRPTCGEPQLKRDTLELCAFDIAFGMKKPILAVCRGAQLVNVALGGSLYQDIPTEFDTDMQHRQTEGIYEYSHGVEIKEGTPLFRLCGKTHIKANSFHHQAIKRLGEGLEVMATAGDGIIEAVYYTGNQYIRAYQWHPERLYGADEFNRDVFSDFIRECVREGEQHEAQN